MGGRIAQQKKCLGFFGSNGGVRGGEGGLVGAAYGVLCEKNIAVGLQHTQIWIKVVKTTELQTPINIAVFILGRIYLNLLSLQTKRIF